MSSLRHIGLVLFTALSVIAIANVAGGQSPPDSFRSGLRGTTPLGEEGAPPRMTSQSNTDLRQVRNYPEQPPVIPHTIEHYQVNANVNQCLSCHARARTADSQAPMVSITHFMDRDGQFLASVSPRRYFCNQCHVPQHPDKAPVANHFIDIDALLQATSRREP